MTVMDLAPRFTHGAWRRMVEHIKGVRLPWPSVERIMVLYLGVIHLGFGAAIFWGGRVRFSSPSFVALLDLTNDRVWPYAAAYALSGLALLLGQGFRVRFAGSVIGVGANSVFSGLFLVAVFTTPTAAATAWWAYFSFATISAVVGALLWGHRRPRHGK